MTEESWFDSRQRQHVFLFFKVQTGYGAHPASYSLDTREFFPMYGGKGLKLTRELRLLLKLRISGAVPPFHLLA